MNLSFAEAVAANMSYAGDPTWVIQIGPMTFSSWDMNPLVYHWNLKNALKGQSQITVDIQNPEQILCGKFKWMMPLTLRFGYGTAMSPTAHLPVARQKQSWRNDAMTISVIGRDESSKMSGGNNKGNHGKGSDKDLMKGILRSRGLNLKADNVSSVNDGCKGGLMNESDRAASYRLGNGMTSPEQSAGGGDSPTSPFTGEAGSESVEKATRDGGLTFSSAEGWKDKQGKGRDKNRSRNHGGRESQAPIKASLEIKAMPTIMAGMTLAVAGYGPDASGTYLVESVETDWSKSGYLSKVEMTRGGSGSGGVGGSAPLALTANIWSASQMVLGPVQSHLSPLATIARGDGRIIGFDYDENPQPHRGGGEGGKKKNEGYTVNLRNRNSAESTNSSGSSGGSDAGAQTGQQPGAAPNQ